MHPSLRIRSFWFRIIAAGFTAALVTLVLSWMHSKNSRPVPITLVGKPAGQIESIYNKSNAKLGRHNTIRYTSPETAKHPFTHIVHCSDGIVVAEEFLFRPKHSTPLFNADIVQQIIGEDVHWVTGKIVVLNSNAMILTEENLFRAVIDSHTVALYQSRGLARLVVTRQDSDSLAIDDLVYDAKLPSEAIRNAIRQAEGELTSKPAIEKR